jgi:ligand-binding sensor domain-containing protein
LADYFAKPLIASVGRRQLILLFFICLLFPFARPAPASEVQYGLKNWTVDDGLPQNSVYAIHQTRDGYLWMATLDGLARFDGVRFTVFNKNNTPGISSNRFISLYEAPDGDLWTGTENGEVIRYQHGAFTTYTTQHGLPNNPVFAITGDEESNLWVLSGRQVIRWENGRFVPASSDHVAVRHSLVHPGSRGGFWGTASNKKLQYFSNGRFNTLNLPNLPVPPSNVSFAEDSKGTIWLASSVGLASIRDDKLVKLFTEGDGLPSNDMYFMFQMLRAP